MVVQQFEVWQNISGMKWGGTYNQTLPNICHCSTMTSGSNIVRWNLKPLVPSGPRGWRRTVILGFELSQLRFFSLLMRRSGRCVGVFLDLSWRNFRIWNIKHSISLSQHMKHKHYIVHKYEGFILSLTSLHHTQKMKTKITYMMREMLQAEDLPVFWLVMMTNSTSSPGLRELPSFTSDWWKNNFFPSSVS